MRLIRAMGAARQAPVFAVLRMVGRVQGGAVRMPRPHALGWHGYFVAHVNLHDGRAIDLRQVGDVPAAAVERRQARLQARVKVGRRASEQRRRRPPVCARILHPFKSQLPCAGTDPTSGRSGCNPDLAYEAAEHLSLHDFNHRMAVMCVLSARAVVMRAASQRATLGADHHSARRRGR